MNMEAILRKWGNSIGLRIPTGLMAELSRWRSKVDCPYRLYGSIQFSELPEQLLLFGFKTTTKSSLNQDDLPSLVPQGFYGIEAGGPAGGEIAEKHSHRG